MKGKDDFCVGFGSISFTHPPLIIPEIGRGQEKLIQKPSTL
jgi:hypothetical protein